MPEWLKGAGCKPAGDAYVGSNPTLPTIFSSVTPGGLGPDWEADWQVDPKYMSGSSSVGRASAFQAECREFESRLPLHAAIAQLVERVLGKDEVTSSNLVGSSKMEMGLFRSQKLVKDDAHIAWVDVFFVMY